MFKKIGKKLYQAILNFCWGYCLLSASLLTAGFLYLCYPTQLPDVIHWIVGCVSILYGVLTAVRLLGRAERGFLFIAQMTVCGAAVLGGGYILFAPALLNTYLGLLVGLWGIMDGSFKLKTAVSAVHYRLLTWWVLVIVALLPILGGVWLLHWTPTEITWLSGVMGCTMLAMGLLNFLALIAEPVIRKRARQEKAREAVVVTVIDSEEARRQASEITADGGSDAVAPTQSAPAVSCRPKDGQETDNNTVTPTPCVAETGADGQEGQREEAVQ